MIAHTDVILSSMSNYRASASDRQFPERPGAHGDTPADRSSADDDWDEFDPYGESPYGDEAYVEGTRILWGRVVILGGALLIAFVLGRMTSAADAAALEAAEQRVTELSADLEQARAELDAVVAGGTSTGTDTAGGATASEAQAGQGATTAEGEAAEGGETPDGEVAQGDGDAAADASSRGNADGNDSTADASAGTQAAGQAESGTAADEPGITHTVAAGDNLYALAEQFYGDGSQWRRIAEANGLAAGAVLNTGQTLRIPTAD